MVKKECRVCEWTSRTPLKSVLNLGASPLANNLLDQKDQECELFPLEKLVIITLEQFPSILQDAAKEQDPSKIANYVYALAKSFNSLLTEHSVIYAESEEKKELRLQLSALTARVIKSAMNLLGIQVPERM